MSTFSENKKQHSCHQGITLKALGLFIQEDMFSVFSYGTLNHSASVLLFILALHFVFFLKTWVVLWSPCICTASLFLIMHL